MSKDTVLWCHPTADGNLEKGRQGGNYEAKIDALTAAGKIPTEPGLNHIGVAHDNWCGINEGKPCNCDPDILLNGKVIEAEG